MEYKTTSALALLAAAAFSLAMLPRYGQPAELPVDCRRARSLFTHLNEAGYRTALLGKTHIAPTESFPYEFLGANPDGSPAFDGSGSAMPRPR